MTMTSDIRTLRPIPTEDFFPAKLTKSISQHNAALSRLQGIEAGLPARRQELARQVHNGAIGGEAALREKRAIDEAAICVNVDRRCLLAERAAMNPDVQKAYSAEAAKTAAEARRTALAEQIEKSGLALTPQSRAQAVKDDAVLAAAAGSARARCHRDSCTFRQAGHLSSLQNGPLTGLAASLG
jgi:hypothetical protein